MIEPLAVQLRPKAFDEVIGQEHLTAKDAAFRKLIESNQFGSFILYGNSGTGKTSIINVIEGLYKIYRFNATTFSVKELRKILQKDEENIIVYIDEIYRMNAIQSDVLLPFVEENAVRLLGCSSENPFHTMRQALLSRCHIYITEPLKQSSIIKVLSRGIDTLKQRGEFKIDKESIRHISLMANGDARKALSILEAAYNYNPTITLETIKKIAPSKYYKYSDDNKYDWVSWLQNAIQFSDVDAAIYALAIALESGEDPRYIARRVLICASEDCYSSPICTAVAHAAFTAAEKIGRPECDLVLAQAVCLIATSKRDKSSAKAIWSALSDVRNNEIIEVPNSLKDVHYPGAEQLGYGACKDGTNLSAYIGINKRYFNEKG